MFLRKISILNYKNIEEASLQFSPHINCFVGLNGMGKTNVLDAIYYLSFCRSAYTSLDGFNVRHGQEFMSLEGIYEDDNGADETIFCGLPTGKRKRLKRNGKDLKKLSEHIGTIPLVLISPSDNALVSGGSEERRKFLDMSISQYDVSYLEALMRYEKALKQRNSMLKADEEPDADVLTVLEDIMDTSGMLVYEKREAFIKTFKPLLQEMYTSIAGNSLELLDIEYQSHGSRSCLKKQLKDWRVKERIVGYTLHGIHKDELLLSLCGYPLKREGSQGQNKTAFISMKLAQYKFLQQKIKVKTPILLLDDIFDKLDAQRVSQIINVASGDGLGQIFITDTDRTHLSDLLEKSNSDYKLFEVYEGHINYGT